MSWMTIDIIRAYEYDMGETNSIVPFAITAVGDEWVWVIDEKSEECCVGICYNAESNGEYYAKNTGMQF